MRFSVPCSPARHHASQFVIAALLCFFTSGARAQVPDPVVPDNRPNTISPIGILPQAATEGTNEQVTLANGALHMFIPLLQIPQRGGWTLPIGYSYDSNYLHNIQLVSVGGGVSNSDGYPVPVDSFSYDEVFANSTDSLMAINLPRLRNSTEYTGAVPQNSLTGPEPNLHVFCVTNWTFSDWNGVSHTFTNSSSCNQNKVRGYGIIQLTDATDGSFYRLDTNNPKDIVVYEKNGTQYHFTGYKDIYDNIPPGDAASGYQVEANWSSRTMRMVDVNGNTVSVNEVYGTSEADLTDTVGRRIVFHLGQTADGQPGDSIAYNDSNSTSPADQRTITLSGLAPGPVSSTAMTFPNTDCRWNGGTQTSPYTTPTVAPTHGSGVPAPTTKTYTQTLTLPAADTSGRARVFQFAYDAADHLTKISYPAGGYTRYEWKDYIGPLDMGYVECSADMFQVANKYECRSSSGQCSQEDQTVYTPSVSTNFSSGADTTSQYNQIMTVADPSGRKTVHAFTVNGQVSQSPLETDVTVSDTSGKMLRSTHTDYTAAPHFTELSFPKKITTTYNDAPSPLSSYVQYAYGQSYPLQVGGSTQTVSLDNVTQADTYDFGGTWIRSVATNWKPDSAFASPHTLDRVDTRTTTDEVLGASVKATYGYDTAGNTTSVSRAGSDGQTQTIGYGAYTNGYPSSITDANGNTTALSYADAWADSACAPSTNTGAYLTKVTMPNGASTSYTYKSCSGLRASETDGNGAVTSYGYDALGRATQTNYADGGQTQIAFVDSTPNTVTTTKLLSASGTPGPQINETILDGLGRKSQTVLQSDPDGATTIDTQYDGVGRIASVSNPYRGSGPGADLTAYIYDPLDRVLKTQYPDGNSTHTDYQGTTADAYDELGNHAQRTTDALGRLTAVIEPDAVSGALASETDYAYDGFDNLRKVDQLGSLKSNNTSTCVAANGTAANGASCDRQRSFVYDSLSRLTSSSNPEAGTIGYSYDGNGNVHTRTDARGIVTTYSYDGLNRLTGKSYANDPSGTPAVNYRYDTPTQGWNFLDQSSPRWTGVQQTNLIGRLSYATSGSSAIVYGYDPLGRTTLKSVCTPSTCGSDHFDLHASYDLAGNTAFADRGLDAARNAASPGAYYYGGLQYIYGSASRIRSAVSDVVDAIHPQSLLNNMTYTPFGSVQAVGLASQYAQVSVYDKRNRMTNRATGNLQGNTILYDLWGYDAAGNVTEAHDSQQGDFTYIYDKLNRVTHANIPPFTEDYGYDAWANQTSHVVTEGSSYQWAYMPTVQNRASNPGVTYDASGNMLSDGLHSYSWDAENRIAGVTDQNVTYKYDPEGMRIATLTSGAVTAEYLYDMSGDLVTTLDGAGRMIRTVLRAEGIHYGDYAGAAAPGGVKTEFRILNQVGTLMGSADSQGNFIEGCLSGPFGDGQQCTVPYDYTETHFTDKLRDQETNNDYFGARYYNSSMGRFLSPDWSDRPAPVPYADPRNPQSLNLYGYVGNNPLSKEDKDGHFEGPPLPDASVQAIGEQFQRLGDIIKAFTSNHPQITNAAINLGLAIITRGESEALSAAEAVEVIPSATSMGAAQRQAMREQGIPTSQQPATQESTEAGMQYTYEIPAPGGGTQTKIVQRNTGTDSSHPGQQHVEAGSPKINGATDSIGRPRLDSNKTKVNVEPPKVNEPRSYD